MRASVVLPVPGGPQKMSEGTWSASMARRSALPGAEDVLLPHELVERAGAQPLRERLRRVVGLGRLVEEIGLHGSPIMGDSMATQLCPVPRRVGIVPKRSSAEAAACADEAERHLAALGLEVLRDDAELARSADLVIVLGGDGTLIHAARLLEGRAAPILGVNMGSLGFLTEVPRSELYPAIDHVLSGKAEVSERMKLRVHVHREPENDARLVDTEVLNDVVISKAALSRIAEIQVTAAGFELATYKADGVIVATPTGSTAYALSANGPIVHPALSAVVLAPICPHTLTQRPVVVPDDQKIDLRLLSDSEVYVTLDGQTGLRLKRRDRVEIKQSSNRVLLVRNPRIDYFGLLRAKLRWGS